MHTSSATKLPHFAIGTLIALGPAAVAEFSEAILPYIPKLVAIYISLGVVCAYTCAARDVAIHSKKPFHLYTIAGLGILLTLQAMINMMVGVGLLPVTGQTLPMVSMGGTSNLITGMAYGIMLSVSNETQRLTQEQAAGN